MQTFRELFHQYMISLVNNDHPTAQHTHALLMDDYDFQCPFMIKNKLFYSILKTKPLYETPYFEDVIDVFSQWEMSSNTILSLLENLLDRENEDYFQRLPRYLTLIPEKHADTCMKGMSSWIGDQKIKRHASISLLGQYIAVQYGRPFMHYMLSETEYWFIPGAEKLVSYDEYYARYFFYYIDASDFGRDSYYFSSSDFYPIDKVRYQFVIPGLTPHDSHQFRTLNLIANIVLNKVNNLNLQTLRAEIQAVTWDDIEKSSKHLIMPTSKLLDLLDLYEQGIIPQEKTLAYAARIYDPYIPPSVEETNLIL